MHGQNGLNDACSSSPLAPDQVAAVGLESILCEVSSALSTKQTSQKYFEHARNRENTNWVARTDPGTVTMKISFQDGPRFKRSNLMGHHRFKHSDL